MAAGLAMLVLLALALTACGASGGGTSDAGDALAYLPADPAVVILVSTDLDSEQWREFDRRVVQEIADDDEPAKTFDEYAEEAFRESGVDREDDVKPLLGNDIAVGIEGDPLALLEETASPPSSPRSRPGEAKSRRSSRRRAGSPSARRTARRSTRKSRATTRSPSRTASS